MISAQRRFLLVDTGLAVLLVNVAINAALAWVAGLGRTAIPLFGGGVSIAADVLATSFALPFLVCLIATPVVRKQIRNGHPPRLPASAGSWLQAASRWKARQRAVALGLIGVATVGPAVLLSLIAAGVSQFSPIEFVVFKAVFVAVLSIPVGPLVGYWALSEPAGG